MSIPPPIEQFGYYCTTCNSLQISMMPPNLLTPTILNHAARHGKSMSWTKNRELMEMLQGIASEGEMIEIKVLGLKIAMRLMKEKWNTLDIDEIKTMKSALDELKKRSRMRLDGVL